MKPFLDSGFLLTLLFETSGSPLAWRIIRPLAGPLHLVAIQCLNVENRLLRQIESAEATARERAVAARALQRFRSYLSEEVFQLMPLDYDVAIHLAAEWQRHLAGGAPPMLLLLWPALAAASGATHFLSFDPRTRQLARDAGLRLVPEPL
jgi:hypothetical protein